MSGYYKNKSFLGVNNGKIINVRSMVLILFCLAFSSSFANKKVNTFGTEKEAKQMLERTIRIVESNPTVAFAMINVGQE